jgi:hypothetical protein
LSIEAYHAGLKPVERQLVFERWIRDETKIIASTIAFGISERIFMNFYCLKLKFLF